MRKSLLLTVCAIGLSSGLFAQTLLTNNGATLVVEPGATLVVQGGVENINGGIINNDGIIDIQGNFLNSATFDGADPNLVIFSGTASANITSGTAVFDSVRLNKSSGQSITLLDDMTVRTRFTFSADNNKVNVGANDLVIQNNGTITSFDANEFVVTGDVGFLRKQGMDPSETFTFPVGFSNAEYNPAILATQVGHVSDVMSVRAIDNLYLDGLAETELATEAAVNAMWEITEGAGTNSNYHLTLQWDVADQLPNFPALVGISRHGGSNWDMLFSQISAPVGADPRTLTRNGITNVGAFAVGGEPVGHELALSMKTYLQGAYVGTTHQDSLRAKDLLPTAEPYAGLGYVHTGFGGGETAAGSVFDPTGNNAITDWVLVELRDATSPNTVLASKSALIQRDGDIVGLDGVNPLIVNGLANGNYHIAVKHRNHLSIRTLTAQALSGTPLVYNFTTGLGQAYDNPDPLILNDAMADLGGGVFGMWGGDAGRNNFTSYNGSNNDKNVVLAAVGNTTPNNILSLVYNVSDVNMDGFVKYNGSANDKNTILSIVGNTTPNNVRSGHNNN